MEFYFNNSNQQPKMKWNLATAALHFLAVFINFLLFILKMFFFFGIYWEWAESVLGLTWILELILCDTKSLGAAGNPLHFLRY